MNQIRLLQVKPAYMSQHEVADSEVYLQPELCFDRGNKYLIKAGSGRGKTSLLNFMYGVSSDFDGEIVYTGLPDTADITEVRQRNLSYVFQDLKLFNDLTVLENIQLKNSITNFKTEASIVEMLNTVGLGHKVKTPLRTLSLGQKQRVAVIRALCQPFDFLFLDEPFSHLDRETGNAVTDMLEKEVDQQGAGVVLTSLDGEDHLTFDQVLSL